MRRIRWTRWLLGAAGAVAVGAVVVYFVVAPWLVRRQILAGLREAGVIDPSFQVRGVSPWETRLVELTAGGGAAGRVGSVSLRYSPGSLWAGKLDSVRMEGAELIVRLGGATPWEGVWADKTAPSGSSSSTSSASSGFPVARIELAASTLHLKGPTRALKLPVHGTLATAPGSPLRVDLRVDSSPLPIQVRGTIAPDTGAVDLAADAESLSAESVATVLRGLLPASNVYLDGTLALAAQLTWDNGQGRLCATLRPDGVGVDLDPATPAPNVTLGRGVYTWDMTFGTATPSGRLAVDDAAAAAPDGQWSVAGVSTDVAFSHLSPVATGPLQELKVGEVVVGDMKLTDGSVLFALRGPRDVEVNATHWTWLDGKLWADGFHVDPSQMKFETTAHAKGVDLTRLLDLLARDKVSGSGRIDARLAVKVDGTNVGFGDGHVTSDGGRVRVADARDVVGTVGAGAAKGSPESRLSTDLAEALKDFRYDILRAELRNVDGQLVARADIRGRGVQGARTPVHYEPTIRGLDDLLRVYLGLQRGLSGATGESE